MNKDLTNNLKKKLEEEKSNLEKGLEKFAKKDERLKDDWDTNFPNWGAEAGGSNSLEKAADEVEEYVTLLPIEHSLELKLRDVNSALVKMEKGKYGICEKCKKDISEERLRVNPAARLCIKCEGK